jgi:hypothetical protein
VGLVAQLGRRRSSATGPRRPVRRGLGLLAVVLAGGAHGLGWLPGRPAVGGFFVLFLLPLVSGALAQLLPVWRFPGR